MRISLMVCSGLAAIAMLSSCGKQAEGTQEYAEDSQTSGNVTCSSALRLISDKPQKALSQLDSLSDFGDSEASFILSRLYFQSHTKSDVTPDSIIRMRKALNIVPDNKLAHQLLIKAAQDPSHYKALYELGCDFYAGPARDPSYERKPKEALRLFYAAKNEAMAVGDREYESMAESMIKRLSN